MAENTTEKNVKSKNRRWALPPQTSGASGAGLYMVATPIGNLGDITLRALDVLDAVDSVVCEDTRVTGKLLSYFGLKKTLIKYNDHSADAQREEIIQAIEEGQALALVSDAGMPLVSDPGYKLIRDCFEKGLYVTSLPGANAPLTALQLSGLPSDQFCFLGFLPAKSTARKKILGVWEEIQAPLIAFETAPRLQATLQDIYDVMGDRDVAVTRELTKLYEEVKRAPVSELIKYYADHGAPKGEIVLVIEGAQPKELSDKEIESALKDALETMSTKEAAAHVSALCGQPKKTLYNLALEISKS